MRLAVRFALHPLLVKVFNLAHCKYLFGSSCPMKPGFETGDVSLTTTIGEVFGEFVLAVVSRDASARYQIGEPEARHGSKFRGPSEGQNSLGEEAQSEFTLQALFHLVLRK